LGTRPETSLAYCPYPPQAINPRSPPAPRRRLGSPATPENRFPLLLRSPRRAQPRRRQHPPQHRPPQIHRRRLLPQKPRRR